MTNKQDELLPEDAIDEWIAQFDVKITKCAYAKLQELFLQRQRNTRPTPSDEVKRLEEDARRYRWLRDGNDSKDSEAVRIATKCYGLEWDKAIDTAMKAALSHKEEAE